MGPNVASGLLKGRVADKEGVVLVDRDCGYAYEFEAYVWEWVGPPAV